MNILFLLIISLIILININIINCRRNNFNNNNDNNDINIKDYGKLYDGLVVKGNYNYYLYINKLLLNLLNKR